MPFVVATFEVKGSIWKRFSMPCFLLVKPLIDTYSVLDHVPSYRSGFELL